MTVGHYLIVSASARAIQAALSSARAAAWATQFGDYCGYCGGTCECRQ